MTSSTKNALQVSSTHLQTLVDDTQKALAMALKEKPLRLAEFVTALDNAVAQSPQLAECVENNPQSVKNAMLTSALLGLRPGPVHKHFALVPYRIKGKMTCVGIPEWRGYVEIANQAGELDSQIVCEVVYEHEVKPAKRGEEPAFAYDRFTGEIKHAIDLLDEDASRKTPDKLVAAYATCKVKGRQGWATVLLTRREVERRRASSAAWKSKGKDSVWGTDPVPMWKKSGMRALLESGKVPMSRHALAEVATAETAAEEVIEEEIKAAHAEVVETDPTPAPGADGPDENGSTTSGDDASVSADDHRVDLLFRFEACLRGRAENDPEKGAKIRAEIEETVGEPIDELATANLEKLVKQMEAKLSGSGGKRKKK